MLRVLGAFERHSPFVVSFYPPSLPTRFIDTEIHFPSKDDIAPKSTADEAKTDTERGYVYVKFDSDANKRKATSFLEFFFCLFAPKIFRESTAPN